MEVPGSLRANKKKQLNPRVCECLWGRAGSSLARVCLPITLGAACEYVRRPLVIRPGQSHRFATSPSCVCVCLDVRVHVCVYIRNIL